MAKNKYTIEDAKKAKIDLEKSIMEQLIAFEEEYGLKISYLSVQRKHEKWPEPKRYEEGDITNVDVSMDMDLVM